MRTIWAQGKWIVGGRWLELAVAHEVVSTDDLALGLPEASSACR